MKDLSSQNIPFSWEIWGVLSAGLEKPAIGIRDDAEAVLVRRKRLCPNVLKKGFGALQPAIRLIFDCEITLAT